MVYNLISGMLYLPNNMLFIVPQRALLFRSIGTGPRLHRVAILNPWVLP